MKQVSVLNTIAQSKHMSLPASTEVVWENAESIYNAEGPQLTFWLQGEEIPLVNKELERQQFLQPIYFLGNESLLFPELVKGSIKENQCAIGIDVAYNLFGGSDVVGLKLWIQGKEYEIVSVLMNQKDFFVSKANRDAEFSRIVFRESGKSYENQIEERLQVQYGIFSEKLPFGVMQWTLEIIGWGIVFILGIGCWLKAYKGWASGDLHFKIIIPWFIMWFMIPVIFSVFFRNIIYLPEVLLPGRWSDFEFWRGSIRNEVMSIRRFISSRHNFVDELFYISYYRGWCFYGLGILSGFILLIGVQVEQMLYKSSSNVEKIYKKLLKSEERG